MCAARSSRAYPALRQTRAAFASAAARRQGPPPYVYTARAFGTCAPLRCASPELQRRNIPQVALERGVLAIPRAAFDVTLRAHGEMLERAAGVRPERGAAEFDRRAQVVPHLAEGVGVFCQHQAFRHAAF